MHVPPDSLINKNTNTNTNTNDNMNTFTTSNAESQSHSQSHKTVTNSKINGQPVQTTTSMTKDHQLNAVGQQMLQMIKTTFGPSKTKLFQADGQIWRSILQIITGIQNDINIPQQFETNVQMNIRSIMLWQRISQLAVFQYNQAINDIKELKELEAGIISSIQYRKDEQKKIATQIFNSMLDVQQFQSTSN